MHLKNFSMIKSSVGWVLAPAYDLLNVRIINPKDKEDLALMMGGKKTRINRSYFERFGADLGLSPKQIDGVFTRFAKNKSKATSWIEQSFLSKEMKKSYHDILNERYTRLAM
jgi:serine/threonine-protein kinase HipA